VKHSPSSEDKIRLANQDICQLL